jgi:hypothetical protein
MKKSHTSSRAKPDADRDTLRPEYDFSRGIRGATHQRYRAGTNVILLDPALMDVFPDSAAVNKALRTLAPGLRRRKRSAKKRRAQAG